MAGKHHYKALRVHKTVFEGLERLLLRSLKADIEGK